MFFRDFAGLAGRKGATLVSGATVVAPAATFLASSDVGLAAASALAVLLVATVLAAHSYWTQLQGERLDLAVASGSLRIFMPKPEAKVAEPLIVIPDIRFTNRSPENKVSLEVALRADVDSGELRLHAVKKGSQGFSEPVILMPLRIAPQETEAGHLAFRFPPAFEQLFGDDPLKQLERRGEGGANARIEVHDFVSDDSITVDVPGAHP